MLYMIHVHLFRNRIDLLFVCLSAHNLISVKENWLMWHFLACRSRQASIILERYFRVEIFLLSILYMLIARMEMGTSRVLGDFDIIT